MPSRTAVNCRICVYVPYVYTDTRRHERKATDLRQQTRDLATFEAYAMLVDAYKPHARKVLETPINERSGDTIHFREQLQIIMTPESDHDISDKRKNGNGADSDEKIRELQQDNALLRTEMDTLSREKEDLKAEIKAQTEKFEHEKAKMSAAAEKERLRLEEKVKLISSFASSHLTGRLGLEARLKASEESREKLVADHQFLIGKMEILGIKKTAECTSLETELERLRRLLTDAQIAQKDMEREKVDLELQYAEHLDEDDVSASVSEVTSGLVSESGDKSSGLHSEDDDDTESELGDESSSFQGSLGRSQQGQVTSRQARLSPEGSARKTPPSATSAREAFEKISMGLQY